MGIQMDHGPDNQISIETARDCWLDDLADSSTELDREVH